MFQRYNDTEMYVAKCTRPYLLKWKSCNILYNVLTIDDEHPLKGDFNDENLRKRLGPNHPYVTFGKFEYNHTDDECVKKHLEVTSYSEGAIHYHRLANSKSSLFEKDFENYPGVFDIKYIEDSKYSLMFNNKHVHSLVFLDFRCSAVIEKTNFLELDCSFYAVEPYIYCMPLAIINNESLPLGLSVGPSESLQIYSQFYELFSKKYPDKKITSLPLLSDEGKALKALTSRYKILHFFVIAI